MVGPIQKIKDALHPGHRHAAGTTATTGNHHGINTGYGPAGAAGYQDPGYATNVQTAAGVPATITVGLGGPGVVGGHNVVREDVTTTTTTTERDMIGERDVAGTVCNVREFVEVEDRPVVKERVERIVEHIPVEKKFVVETRPVGEQLLAGQAHVESLGVTEAVVSQAAGTVCPTTGAVDRALAGGHATTTYDACAGGVCDRNVIDNRTTGTGMTTGTGNYTTNY